MATSDVTTTDVRNNSAASEASVMAKASEWTVGLKKVLTLAQAAEWLQMSELTVRRLIWRGQLQQVPDLHLIRITEDELNRFISGRNSRGPVKIRRTIWRQR